MVDKVRGMHEVPASQRSTSELINDLGDELTRLVRTELRLARNELREKGKRAGVGAGMLGTSGVLALLGGSTLIACVVLAISLVLPAWAATLIVGGALLLLAGLTALMGRSQLRRSGPPIPEQTMSSVREDVRAVREGTKR